jgi:signal transduction histidine kinase
MCYFSLIMKPPENRNGRGPAAKSASDAARAAMDAWTTAAFIIDLKAAALVEANAEGRTYFPAVGSRPAALDSAMPAVQALRRVARSGAMPAGPVPLVFWTERGIRRFSAQVEQLKGTEGQILLLVKVVEPSDVAVAGPPQRREEGTTSALEIADAGEPSGSPTDVDEEPAATRTDPANTDLAQIDLAKLAHELKTPISAISAASEIMKEGRFGQIENQRYAGYIADIHESARHALDLIERMLNRRSDGTAARKSEFKFEKIGLDALVEVCMSTLHPLASAKGLSLAAQRAATPAIVTADATALKQIVLNLIMNAIKFTPAGGSITVATLGSRQGAAALRVEDTGPGMTPNAVLEAMRPVPLDLPRVRDGGGLGLGLPMSRALAEAMGAQLSIDSALGRGTRVTLTFPGGPLLVI